MIRFRRLALLFTWIVIWGAVLALTVKTASAETLVDQPVFTRPTYYTFTHSFNDYTYQYTVPISPTATSSGTLSTQVLMDASSTIAGESITVAAWSNPIGGGCFYAGGSAIYSFNQIIPNPNTTLYVVSTTTSTVNDVTPSMNQLCIQLDFQIPGVTPHDPDVLWGDGTNPYIVITDNGTPLPPITVGTSTQIISVAPADQSTVASTSVPISIQYYVNSSETPELTDIGYLLMDVSKNYRQIFDGIVASTTMDAFTTYTGTITLTAGDTYEISPFLTDDAMDAFKSGGAATVGTATNGSATFSVVVNNLGTYLGASSTANLYTLSTTTCSITNISGCFQNALIWAFYPSQDVLNLIAQDGGQVKNKPPFGYFFVNIAALQALSASSSPAAFTLMEDWPIMHYIFQPFAAGLVGVIWFAFGVWFFLHVREIVP